MSPNERVAPYPNPDYSDPDLLTKEVTTGAFIPAIFQELASFRPPMERYEASLEDISDAMKLKGNFNLQAVEIELHNEGMGWVKQFAWLPYFESDAEPEPEIVYMPREHYGFVEYRGWSSEELNIPIVENFYASTPYYDKGNAGLFGTKVVKNEDGNIVERYCAFYSLVNGSISILGKWPDDIAFDSRVYIGFVKGAAIFSCYVSDTVRELISFDFEGGVHRLIGAGTISRPLGESGLLATTIGGDTAFLDTRLNEVSRVNGDFCSSTVGEATPNTPYPFGAKIGRAIYYPKDDEAGYKFVVTRGGPIASETTRPIWTYRKAVKYDYSTDGWNYAPRKYLGYNLIRNGLFPITKMPCRKTEGEVCVFKGGDMYGDFVEVEYPDGKKSLWHTLDFEWWHTIDDERALDRFYGFWGRLWVAGRPDGIVGFMPYTMAVMDVDDKMVMIFDGFVFRI